MNLLNTINDVLHNGQKIKELHVNDKLQSPKDIENAMKYIDKIMFLLQEIKSNEATIIYICSIAVKVFSFFKKRKKDI